jgi:hypothetical protein
MRNFASYVLAGILVVLAMDVIAPPAGLGLAVVERPAVSGERTLQSVNRTRKGDRLQIPAADSRRPVAPQAPAMLMGCEPLFSSLSSAARANYPRRCIA